MARPSTAASKLASTQQGTIRSTSPGSLSREQKLELYYFMRLTRLLEERLVNLYREWLDAPVLRVTAADVPLPYSPPLEDYVLPQTSDIVMALRKLAAY